MRAFSFISRCLFPWLTDTDLSQITQFRLSTWFTTIFATRSRSSRPPLMVTIYSSSSFTSSPASRCRCTRRESCKCDFTQDFRIQTCSLTLFTLERTQVQPWMEVSQGRRRLDPPNEQSYGEEPQRHLWARVVHLLWSDQLDEDAKGDDRRVWSPRVAAEWVPIIIKKLANSSGLLIWYRTACLAEAKLKTPTFNRSYLKSFCYTWFSSTPPSPPPPASIYYKDQVTPFSFSHCSSLSLSCL